MGRMRAKYRKNEHGEEVLQTYIAEYYDRLRHPRRKRVSLLTRDEGAATQKFAELERKYMAGLWDPWRDGIDGDDLLVSEAISAFLKSREGRSPSTIANYRNILRIFRESLPPGLPVRALERRHVQAFLTGQRLNQTSRRTYVRHLRVFFRWCLKHGYIRDDPTPTLDRNRKRERRKVPKFLREDQYTQLLEAIASDAAAKPNIVDGNRWLSRPIRFSVGTGLRRGEVCNLRWSAVDLETGFIYVVNIDEEDMADFTTKSGEERAVPLVGDARAVIEEILAEREAQAPRSGKTPGKGTPDDAYVFTGVGGNQLNAEHLSKRFRYYRDKKARLPKGIRFHSLRHTFASWWVQRGGDLYRLREVMGHSSVEQTMIYAHLRPAALQEEMEKCFGSSYATAHAGFEPPNVTLPTDARSLRTRIATLESELTSLRLHLKDAADQSPGSHPNQS